MLPDRVSNPGPLTYESGVLPIALRGPAHLDLTRIPLLVEALGELGFNVPSTYRSYGEDGTMV